MTICIAALADESRAIVCVADKMLSFGEGATLQWDSDVTKIIPSGKNNTVALVAGQISHCTAVLNEVSHNDDFDRNIADSVDFLKKVYKKTFSEFQDTTVLHAAGLDRELYHDLVRGSQSNRIVEEIIREMGSCVEKLDCDLIYVGLTKTAVHLLLA